MIGELVIYYPRNTYNVSFFILATGIYINIYIFFIFRLPAQTKCMCIIIFPRDIIILIERHPLTYDLS